MVLEFNGFKWHHFFYSNPMVSSIWMVVKFGLLAIHEGVRPPDQLLSQKIGWTTHKNHVDGCNLNISIYNIILLNIEVSYRLILYSIYKI